MKTLVLLSALALLAFLAQADPLPEAIEDAKNKEQSGIEDKDFIVFGDPENSARQDAAARKRMICNCRKYCFPSEQLSGFCPLRLLLCCR